MNNLRAIEVMCPQLKHISFHGGFIESVDGDLPKSRFEKELEIVLKGWTQTVEVRDHLPCIFFLRSLIIYPF